MKLVIAEKPSVARSISEVLGASNKKNGYLEGNGYLVSWCIGHLVELASADTYKEEWKKWDYQTLPIIPKQWQHNVKSQTKAQYQVLKQLLHNSEVTEVICATDAGREGELIFRLVYEQAGCKKPIKRLWISSMEEQAIADGFANLKDGKAYENLYQSARCRSEADWLVGINGTRLFTVLYCHPLSVGRVQTPTLAMLVDREQSIAEFRKTPYYIAHLQCNGMDAVTEKIVEKGKAEQIAKACLNGQAFVTSVTKEEKKERPPKLYDLTTLQREANRLFGYTAQQTLDYTQSLYEKKLVTYPRTDSRFLTDDMGATARGIIKRVKEVHLFGTIGTEEPDMAHVLDSKKVTDHHAIIPTMELSEANLTKVPKGELLILQLIAMKLLCATAQPHMYEMTKAELRRGEELFVVSGKRILQKGWKELETLLKQTFVSENRKEKQEETPLPELAEGMVFSDIQSKVTEHMTSPPKHYTEDTLLSAMEHVGNESMGEDVERKGLGTPATRAAIIEKLVEKGVVQRKSKQLLPTEKGSKLITILPEIVKSPKLTAEWENELNLIAKGEKSADSFMEDIKNMVSELVSTYHEIDESRVGIFGENREVIGSCPKCGGNVYESKVNFYCEHRACGFALFKNNKYFAAMRKELTKSMVQAFLKHGRVKVNGLYSKKKDATFSATIVLDASGKYPQFSMEFGNKK